MVSTHPQDDILIVLALYHLSDRFDDHVITEHAYQLAVDIAATHGLTPEDAVRNVAYFRHPVEMRNHYA